MARLMEVSTPLGDEVLLFHSMQAREQLSHVSDYRLTLLSRQGDVPLDDVLGRLVTVRVATADDQTRYFNGYVTRLTQSGMLGRYHQYQAVVRPWLWFLTRTADCRIFQDMTVPDIVKAVFSDHTSADYRFELTDTYRTWTYCVQYRESDFNFVSRLLEHEGIYYYFAHTNGHDTMVLTDSASKHAPVAGCEALPYIPPERPARPDIEHVSGWDVSREVQPGVYVHDDYDLERPSVNLETRKAIGRGYMPSDYEIYDYPGEYVKKTDGDHYAGVRIDEFGSQFETASGSSNARHVMVGRALTLTGHPRGDQNREYLVVATNYDLQIGAYEAMEAEGAGVQCGFVAIPKDQQFRPARTTPRPFVQGPQTAMVVGPAGDEIYTDKYGRVKVQFHWDRYGKRDQNSSCWIRVSHPWAGKGWGAVATPRIGQEVIVDFLEGDPDQPIVTGRVYNAENQPPFGFPAGAVKSGVKSDTHKGSGYNELSFDDTNGAEQITIHGQFDMHTSVEHDQSTTVHRHRTDRVDVDDSESVGANQSLTVGKNRTKDVGVDETITIGSNRSSTVGASETATVTLQRTHTVGVNETISVGAAQEITVGGMQATTVGVNQSTAVGGSRSVEVGRDQTHQVGGSRTASIAKDDTLTVGKHLVITAGDSIAIKTGGASITMKKDGTITIKGKDITIEGSGKVNVKASGDITMKGSKILQN